MNNKITQEKLKELFEYSPDGTLIRKVCRSSRAQIGDVAGTLKADGYHRISIDRVMYLRSRLVFCFHNGYFPENEVDHRNQIRDDDRIQNLREVSRQCNMRNTGNRGDSVSGIKGIYWYKARQKWHARIMVSGLSKHLGLYKSLDNAAMARWNAEKKYGWENCCTESTAYLYLKLKGVIK